MNGNSRNMKRITTRAVGGMAFAVLAILLAACGGTLPTPSTLETMAATLPVAPAVTQAVGTLQAITPTALDPCQLVPPEEASALAGTSFGAGNSETEVGGMRTCTYGAQTGNVFTVQVLEAPDETTAKVQEGQFMAALAAQIPQLSSQAVKVTQLPNLGDGAIVGEATLPTQLGTVNGSALGVVKGKVFVGFSNIVTGGPAPTSQSLQDEAAKILSRLP